MITCIYSKGQISNVPENLEDAISFLRKDCPDSIKQTIKLASRDSIIYFVYPYVGAYKRVAEWTITGDSGNGIRSFLSSKGIRVPFNQQCAVWFAFQQALPGLQDAPERSLTFYQHLERKWRKEDDVRYTTDSLRGFYIPVDLLDCIVQIKKMLPDSPMEQLKRTKPEKFINESHLNFGMYLRNSWQLWKGSRLTRYFNDLGIDHPDTMSGAILAAYYQHIVVKDFNLCDYEEKLAAKYAKYKRRGAIL